MSAHVLLSLNELNNKLNKFYNVGAGMLDFIYLKDIKSTLRLFYGL